MFRNEVDLKTLPSKEGWYFWSEWGAEVLIYKKDRGKKLFVTPPNGVEIEIKPTIAGKFKFRRGK